jgi:hypothetical protein
MTVIATETEELQLYLTAREALTALEQHLDDPSLWANVLEPSDMTTDRLDDVVGTLSRQARAARQLALAAETLCAALVGESHYTAD